MIKMATSIIKYVLMARDELGYNFRVNDVVYEFPNPITSPLFRAFCVYEAEVIEEVRETHWIAPEWTNLRLERQWDAEYQMRHGDNGYE